MHVFCTDFWKRQIRIGFKHLFFVAVALRYCSRHQSGGVKPDKPGFKSPFCHLLTITYNWAGCSPVTLISTSPPSLSFLNASNSVPHRVQPKGHFSIVIFNVICGGREGCGMETIFNQETKSWHINLPKPTRVKY